MVIPVSRYVDSDASVVPVDGGGSASGGGPVAPELQQLYVSPATATVGQLYEGVIYGRTTGSTITLSGAGAAGLSVLGDMVRGTPTTNGTVDLTETLDGASRTTLAALETGGGVPVPPDGFQILLGQDGQYLTGADGAPLYGKAA